MKWVIPLETLYWKYVFLNEFEAKALTYKLGIVGD